MIDENGDECRPLTGKEQLQILGIYILFIVLVVALVAAPFLI